MAITDELREYARGCAGGMGGDALLHIADRIDAEHERAMADAELAAASTEAQLEKLGYIALPVDADGAPIHVGDMVEDADAREIAERVMQIRYTLATAIEAPSVLVSIITDASQLPQKPVYYRHYHAPTVEDVLREFAANIADVLGGDDFKLDDNDELYAEFAAKLRLAGDGE